MKQWFKRIGAVLLTVAMLATMVPAVFAANTLSTSVSGLSASWEYTSKYSGTATWTSTGNSISATSKGYRQPDVSALTLTNNSGIEAELSFNWTFTTGGTTTGRNSPRPWAPQSSDEHPSRSPPAADSRATRNDQQAEQEALCAPSTPLTPALLCSSGWGPPSPGEGLSPPGQTKRRKGK